MEVNGNGQASGSHSAAVFPLPSVLEWLQIISAEFDSILTIAQKEIVAVREEYVNKNARELMEVSYRSSKISERVTTEYSRIVSNIVKNLVEHQSQYEEELATRFPKLRKERISRIDTASLSSQSSNDRTRSPSIRGKSDRNRCRSSSEHSTESAAADGEVPLPCKEVPQVLSSSNSVCFDDSVETPREEGGDNDVDNTMDSITVVPESEEEVDPQDKSDDDGISDHEADPFADVDNVSERETNSAAKALHSEAISRETTPVRSYRRRSSNESNEFDVNSPVRNSKSPTPPSSPDTVVDLNINSNSKTKRTTKSYRDFAPASPTETVIIPRKKKTCIDSDSKEEDEEKDESHDEIESVDITKASLKYSNSLKTVPRKPDTRSKAHASDPKLEPKACFVRLEELPKIVLDRLRTHKYVLLDERKSTRRNKSNELQTAIQRLMEWQPEVDLRSNNSKGRSKDRSKSSPAKAKASKNSNCDSRTSDDSDDEGEGGERNKGSTANMDDNSSSREGEPSADRSSNDEDAAKAMVLASDDSDTEVKAKAAKDTAPSTSNEKKSKSVIPSECNLRKEKNTDTDSSDDFIKPVKKKQSIKRAVSDNEASSSDEFVIQKSKSRKKRGRSRTDSDVQEIDQKPRRKRIRPVIDDDSSDSSSNGIKVKAESKIVEISSDSDVQEVDAGDKANKNRKSIRKIMDAKKETKLAEEEEKKRKKRVAERQKTFNEQFTAPDTAVCEELVLDVDETTKAPLVKVDKSLVKHLKPHQVQGVRFLWNSCIESVAHYKQNPDGGGGCILAHCMGLGKTLQTITFLHTIMTYKELNFKQVLVMCPLNTVANWHTELKTWLKNVEEQIYLHKLYDAKNMDHKVQLLSTWKRRGGVGIINYDAFRGLVTLVDGKNKKVSAEMKSEIKRCLLDPGPQLVVCDEGHMLRNDKSKISQTVNRVSCKRRVILTGTPLQNNLLEYHCMVNFVKPNLLGSKKEFANRFVNPITHGSLKDSTARDVSVMKKRSHVLHTMLDGCVQRLDYSVLLPFLPPKYEYVVLLKLTSKQETLYKYYLESVIENTVRTELLKAKSLFKHSSVLSRVWSHPAALLMKSERYKDASSDSVGSLKDFIDDDDDTEEETTETSDIEIIPTDKVNENQPIELPMDETIIDVAGNDDWWRRFFVDEDVELLEHGCKMVVLMEILKICEEIEDKVLVFSQYLYSLDLIERFLENISTSAASTRRWRKDTDYFRIDGSTKTHDRERTCQIFNRKDTARAKLFLISTKAGGLGINLVGANRVIIFDASWNPSLDMQSIYRVFRFGQTKPCYVYRLIAKGTMEEKIYNRQVVKLSLSGRVVDEHQIERHFTFEEMAKMYEYEVEDKPELPIIPKDRLLADLLISHKEHIHSYFEHDSLLQNKVDECLTEEERKAAWEEYENEKNNKRPVLPNFAANTALSIAIERYAMKLVTALPGESSEFYNFGVEHFRTVNNHLAFWTLEHQKGLANSDQLKSMQAMSQVKGLKNSIVQMTANPAILKETYEAQRRAQYQQQQTMYAAPSTSRNIPGLANLIVRNQSHQIQQPMPQPQQPMPQPQQPISLSSSIFDDKDIYDSPSPNILRGNAASRPTANPYVSAIPTKTVPYNPGSDNQN